MAEALMRHKVMHAGLAETIDVDSAGLGAWHVGEPPHRGTRQILDVNGVSYSGQKARQLETSDFRAFDYIITMDHANFERVEALLIEENDTELPVLRPMMSFVENPIEDIVPDPYYDGRYSYVYGLLDTACDALLDALKDEHQL
jgi:protein-tyrosine phosphatase